MIVFLTRSIWLELGISEEARKEKAEAILGCKRDILERDQAISCLQDAIEKSTANLLKMVCHGNSFESLLKLINILNEIMDRYLEEKKSRTKMVENNIREEDLLDTVTNNRNVERSIIDACNIWIENCVLFQQECPFPKPDLDRKVSVDSDLLLELFIYGCVSQALTLIRLSKDLEEGYFYGMSINPEGDVPLNVLRNHPVIYYNPALGGNQSLFKDKKKHTDLDHMMVAKGFREEYGISFSLFLGTLIYLVHMAEPSGRFCGRKWPRSEASGRVL